MCVGIIMSVLKVELVENVGSWFVFCDFVSRMRLYYSLNMYWGVILVLFCVLVVVFIKEFVLVLLVYVIVLDRFCFGIFENIWSYMNWWWKFLSLKVISRW